ncbi:MAG: DUF1080 domain-containing protein [Isosphaera sp.]|nr:DUF1080 domain-containing protein [Isosphaera sp.]
MTGTRAAVWATGAVAVAASAAVALQVKEYKSGIVWPEPKVVAPGKTDRDPPADAVVLFDGKDLSRWDKGENWEVKDGVATVRKSDITTKDAFGDCQLHLEFATPEKVEGKGQGRGNSGVFLMGKYEVQILDSVDNPTYFDGQAAAVYKQSPPMVNASRGPGEWQTYDIVFTAPRFAPDGKVAKPAYVTVVHNGVVVHNHFELLGGTFFDRPPAYEKHAERLPIRLQNHGNPVRFRNIWVREIAPIEGKKPQ